MARVIIATPAPSGSALQVARLPLAPGSRGTSPSLAGSWLRGGEEGGRVPLEPEPHAGAVEVVGVPDPDHAHRDRHRAAIVDAIQGEHALLPDLDEELRGEKHAAGAHVQQGPGQGEIARRETRRGHGRRSCGSPVLTRKGFGDAPRHDLLRLARPPEERKNLTVRPGSRPARTPPSAPAARAPPRCRARSRRSRTSHPRGAAAAPPRPRGGAGAGGTAP